MKMIGVAGFARSGKDTIAAFLVQEYGFKRVAFADAMREMLYATNPIITIREIDRNGDVYISPIVERVRNLVDRLGWDKAKVAYPEIRELLQRLGTEAGRKVLGDTVWTDALFYKAKQLGGDIVVSDVRMEDECTAIRAAGGKIIRVNRPGISSVNDHITDRRLPEAFVDYEVTNDGTIDELNEKIRKIVKP